MEPDETILAILGAGSGKPKWAPHLPKKVRGWGRKGRDRTRTFHFDNLTLTLTLTLTPLRSVTHIASADFANPER